MKFFQNTVLLSVLFLLLAFSAQAQQRGGLILDEVYKKHKSYDAIHATFSVEMENKDAGVEGEAPKTGEIYVKGDKYKVIFDDIERMSDNISVWTYFKDEDEVQITEVDPEESEFSPSKIFSIYKNDFRYESHGSLQLEGIACYEIELRPKDAESPYYRFLMTVEKSTKNIRKIILSDKNKTDFIYQISKIERMGKNDLDDSFFMFDSEQHKNVEQIDLR